MTTNETLIETYDRVYVCTCGREFVALDAMIAHGETCPDVEAAGIAADIGAAASAAYERGDHRAYRALRDLQWAYMAEVAA